MISIKNKIFSVFSFLNVYENQIKTSTFKKSQLYGGKVRPTVYFLKKVVSCFINFQDEFSQFLAVTSSLIYSKEIMKQFGTISASVVIVMTKIAS